jgi:hypothetical protein
VHGNRSNTHFFTSAVDAQGDLAAVRNQNFFKHFISYARSGHRRDLMRADLKADPGL